jgi:hypothetical protein
MISKYFMTEATYINEIKLINFKLNKTFINKIFIKPLLDKHIYNLEKLTLKRMKTLSIFDVDSLVAALEKFLLINEIEIDEC